MCVASKNEEILRSDPRRLQIFFIYFIYRAFSYLVMALLVSLVIMQVSQFVGCLYPLIPADCKATSCSFCPG